MFAEIKTPVGAYLFSLHFPFLFCIFPSRCATSKWYQISQGKNNQAVIREESNCLCHFLSQSLNEIKTFNTHDIDWTIGLWHQVMVDHGSM